MKPRKKILFICPYPEGMQAGQRFKYEQYFELFRKNNFDVEVSSFINLKLWNIIYRKGNLIKKIYYSFLGYVKRIREIKNLNNYDIIYIFMWVVPLGGNFFEKIYLNRSKITIYDIEDNILINYKKKNNLIAFLRSQEKILYLIKNCNYIITSSPYLSEICQKISKKKFNIEYISASIHLERYYPIKKHIKKSKIVLGWTGTHSSKPYLDILKNVFTKIKKNNTNIIIKIISDFNYQVNDLTIENVRWNKQSEIQDLLDIDIGIYPLSNEEWVKGKSGLKALQYMSLGIPVIATKVGMNKKIIKNMENGLLVNNDDREWLNAINILAQDHELRNKIGKNSRKTISENYSTNIIGNKYLKILNSL